MFKWTNDGRKEVPARVHATRVLGYRSAGRGHDDPPLLSAPWLRKLAAAIAEHGLELVLVLTLLVLLLKFGQFGR